MITFFHRNLDWSKGILFRCFFNIAVTQSCEMRAAVKDADGFDFVFVFVDFVFGSSVAVGDEEFRLLFQLGTLNGDLGEDGVAQCV